MVCVVLARGTGPARPGPEGPRTILVLTVGGERERSQCVGSAH
jgi:hypothetical protein